MDIIGVLTYGMAMVWKEYMLLIYFYLSQLASKVEEKLPHALAYMRKNINKRTAIP